MSMPNLSEVQMQNNPMFGKLYLVYIIEPIEPIDITDYYIGYLDENINVIVNNFKDMHKQGINIDGLTKLFDRYTFSQLKITCLDKFTSILDARGSVLYYKQKYRYEKNRVGKRFDLIRIRNAFFK